MNAILIENLSKTYRTGFGLKRLEVVHDLSLSVNQGEIYGFIGPNGAGKTTTLKILVGLSRPSSGRILVFGQDSNEVSHKARLGFLPERPYFYEYLTAAEFLDFYGRLFNIPAKVRRERAQQLLEQVSLGPFRDTPLRKYSKGMLQRIGVAQALMNDPELVVLDEPMSGLDPLGRMLIRDLILGLKARGKTVFFSSHILSDVELICDRVGVLVGGRRKGEGTLDELLSNRDQFIEVVLVPAPDDAGGLTDALVSAGLEVSPQPDRVLVKLKDEALRSTVMEIISSRRAQLESWTPRRKSLEDLFMDELAAARKFGIDT